VHTHAAYQVAFIGRFNINLRQVGDWTMHAKVIIDSVDPDLGAMVQSILRGHFCWEYQAWFSF
jgi:hypothetical protein